LPIDQLVADITLLARLRHELSFFALHPHFPLPVMDRT
jgi:hypothetical protein